VHCDVKPGNVMLDRGGNIYLTDFGIARHSESTTTTLATVGTAAYIAPEQIRGEPVSPATDVYALGVMLFEMLTGQRPFKGDAKGTDSSGATANERIRYGHLTQPAPDPRQFNTDLSEVVARVVLRALNKDHHYRYQSMHELYTAFCNAVNVNPGSIPDRFTEEPRLRENNVIPSREMQPKTKRNTRRAILLVVLGFAAIMIAIIINLMALEIDLPTPESIVRTHVLNTDQLIIKVNTATPWSEPTEITRYAPAIPPTDTLTQYNTSTATGRNPSEISKSPVGKIVYTCEVIRDNVYDQICIISADGTGQRQLTDTEGSAIHPSLSPDGSQVVFVSNMTGDHDIYELDLATGAIGRLTFGLGDPTYPRISPDGSLIAFTNKRNNVVSLYIYESRRDGYSQYLFGGWSTTCLVS